jgi:GR25 family glycosyltransferase involved in LPS biosynthesis
MSNAMIDAVNAALHNQTENARPPGDWGVAQFESEFFGGLKKMIEAGNEERAEAVLLRLTGGGLGGAVAFDLLAKTYERQNKPEQALLALERGLQLRPADSSMLSRRVMALVRLGREEEAEELAADCVARFPAEVELHLTYAVLPFYFAKLRTAFVRLVAFTKAFPDSRAGYRRLADVAAGLYRYKDAVAALDELMRRHKRIREAVQPLHDELMALAQAQIIASAECGPPGIAAIPMDICVINMDHDQARLDTMVGWYSDIGLQLQRIGAVRARYLPALLMRRIADTAKVAVGTVGCFLSHIAAWETVSIAERPALILEDDACPTFRFSDDVSRIDLPEGFDVCFVNKRMALHTPLTLEGMSRIPTIPIRDVVATRSPQQRGVGCDGYILSPEGARKLLAFVEKDGVLGHVDFQVLGYAVEAADLDGIAEDGFFFEVLRRYLRRRDPSHSIRAFATYPAFVREVDHGHSARNVEN